MVTRTIHNFSWHPYQRVEVKRKQNQNCVNTAKTIWKSLISEGSCEPYTKTDENTTKYGSSNVNNFSGPNLLCDLITFCMICQTHFLAAALKFGISSISTIFWSKQLKI
jgi:hypothetical protein